MEFLNDNRVKVDPPKKPKKLTATRFATILGLNAWATPFAAWCEMTRTYEEPFTDSIYTVAGKIIEPKVIEYLKTRYFMDIKSPTDVYGADYFRKTWGDFFPDVEGLGGMWDAIGDTFVVEIKTTKRAEDWLGVDDNPDPPINYKLQAALYAYLLGFDDVVMSCSFLKDTDYPIQRDGGTFDTAPTEAYIPTVNNTIVVEFKVSEDFPTFVESYVVPAMRFWHDHVLTGISPEFDEKRDAEILEVLRKNTVTVEETDVKKMIAEADKLQSQIDKAEAKIEDKKKRLKEITEKIKSYMGTQFRPGDKKVEIVGKSYTWTLSKTVRNSLDSTALKKDLPDVFGKYSRSSEVYTLKKSIIEEV